MHSRQLHNFKVGTQYVSTPTSLAPPLHFNASLLINNALITESKSKNVTMQMMVECETQQYINWII